MLYVVGFLGVVMRQRQKGVSAPDDDYVSSHSSE